MKTPKNNPKKESTGKVIIQAVIRSASLSSVVCEGGRTIFIWSDDARQKIQAALEEAGYMLQPIPGHEMAKV